MINTKLILICGISGAGKSTTSRKIAQQLTENNIQSKWLHEETRSHPLRYTKVDREKLDNEKNIQEYLKGTLILWENFCKKVQKSKKVYVVEGMIFESTIRILFDCNLPEKAVPYVNKILEVIKSLNPAFIFLYKKDVQKSFENIWQYRGKEWKSFFIKLMEKKPYCQKNNLKGEKGIIKQWQDYQEFAKSVFKKININKKYIEPRLENKSRSL